MKITSLSNPVMSNWLAEQGLRLDASPYVSGSLNTKKLLEQLPKTEPLASLTRGHNGGIFNGPMFRRVYLTDPEHSVPFLGTKDMMAADLTGLPRLRKSDAESATLSYLRLKPGMTLISCSGFNAGRRAYVRPNMGDCWSSQDTLKVEPDSERIKPGYLYAFLLSRFGESLVRGSVYGSAVKHIEPHHIAGIPVPRFEAKIEDQIHDLVEECARLRASFQADLVSASQDFFKSAGLPELDEYQWHQEDRDLGFEVNHLSPLSLRAMNYGERAQRLKAKLASVPHRSLGDICSAGQLRYGPIFKRVDSDLDHGGRLLVGQRQGWWIRPEDGRVISLKHTPAGAFVPDETVMIGGHGMPSESGLFGKATLVTGRWLHHAYSQDFLRVTSGTGDVSGAYLLSFFRSTVAMRLIRSMLTGGGQQSIHSELVTEMPIPISSPDDRERIEGIVRNAYQNRDRADVLEDKALALLTTAIEEAAG
ncbi:methylation-associated defense system restriction endonuclease subunit S MAD5 [Streptomyces ficellus]|uniref:Restriction endonuclease subunit S n=1 Tax=Streptomyces ficellus TaxID=1977088 RepID=A0A6I6F5N7_9ACTN|nr:restriction endonuclease subunit S [Streptomyces ficellus]QGV78054.1 restriction endonuclease subunit S [Streptomyces ficellus]